MSIFDDMADIFVDVFQDEGWLLPPDVDAVRVYGVFTKTWISQDAGDYAGIDGQYASYDMRKADLPSCFRENGMIDIPQTGRRYSVKSIRPDDGGMVKLVLLDRGAGADYDGVAA